MSCSVPTDSQSWFICFRVPMKSQETTSASGLLHRSQGFTWSATSTPPRWSSKANCNSDIYFSTAILIKSLRLRYYFLTQPGISLRTVRLISQGKQADRLIIPIGPIQNSDRSSGRLTRNQHTIQIHANETIWCAACNTTLNGVKVRSCRLCLFHEPGPILIFKNKKRVTQPPQSGSRSPCRVSALRASLNPLKAVRNS